MSNPKRHHWWPQLQSSLWTAADGLIHVTGKDGTTFRTSPQNIGLEGELYTRFAFTGGKDVTIERWFANEIETPFARALTNLTSVLDIKTCPFLKPDSPAQRAKAKDVKDLGFVLPKKFEWIELTLENRQAVVNYLAAMLVRNPTYLAKLGDFHRTHSQLPQLDIPKIDVIKSH